MTPMQRMYPGLRHVATPMRPLHDFVKFVPAADEMRIACARCRRLLTIDESIKPCVPKENA